MAAVICGCFNQSGGCCKTTTVASLGIYLARRGIRVLLVDADGQRDLSKIYGYDEPEKIAGQANITTVIRGDAHVREAIVQPVVDGEYRDVDLLLGGMTDALLERYIAAGPIPELWMTRLLRPIAGDYDFILIDGPGSMGIMGQGAVMACHRIIGVSKSQEKEVRGLTELDRTLIKLNTEVREDLSLPPLVLDGVILGDAPTNYPLAAVPSQRRRRTRGAIYYDVADLVMAEYQDKVLLPFIRSSVKVPEAYSNMVPLPLWFPADTAARDYELLADELIKRGFTRHRSHAAA
jgi:chromosome partitioning protein